MTDDPRHDLHCPRTKKNPTTAIGAFIVVVVLLVIGTLLFNAIREKSQFDEQNAPPSGAVSGTARPAAPAVGASQ